MPNFTVREWELLLSAAQVGFGEWSGVPEEDRDVLDEFRKFVDGLR